jgi:hypothetical protein
MYVISRNGESEVPGSVVGEAPEAMRNPELTRLIVQGSKERSLFSFRDGS